MPDPERVVTRSLGVLGRHGYGQDQSLGMIAYAADTAALVLRHGGIPDTWWLDGIADNARSRMRSPGPVSTA